MWCQQEVAGKCNAPDLATLRPFISLSLIKELDALKRVIGICATGCARTFKPTNDFYIEPQIWTWNEWTWWHWGLLNWIDIVQMNGWRFDKTVLKRRIIMSLETVVHYVLFIHNHFGCWHLRWGNSDASPWFYLPLHLSSLKQLSSPLDTRIACSL